ncbi:MAG: sensor histidine kinase [Actinomycetes bacterium]
MSVAGTSRLLSGAVSGDGGELSVEDLPDGVIVAGPDRRVVAVNRRAGRILGTDPADLVGKPLEDALPLEDLEGRRWWVCNDPWDGLATRSGHPERNLLLPGAREVLVTARYVRPAPLAPVKQVVVALRDTRAREREELSRAELVSTVAHELRSPLTSVKGFTATLLAKWDRFTDAQKRLMLETVDADADRVTRLITELLDIARIDSGRLEVHRSIVDLPRAVRRHVDSFLARGEPEDRFTVEVREPLTELWADADKVDQVLANLLENAVRHGDGRVTIVVEPGMPFGGPEGSTAVMVRDEGDGIPRDLHQRVFTKFWRSGKRGGTGLGLYIVRGLVEAHGGGIAIGEAAGGGAEFRFWLPAGTPDFQLA